jgi:hypothetical protein
MRAIGLAAAVILTSCAASSSRYTARAAARDAQAITAARAPRAFALADWIPAGESAPWVVERRADRTTVIDGSLRASLHRSGAVEVAVDRTQRALTQVFVHRDGRWVFVTEDGIVLSSAEFLGAYTTRAELPAGVDRTRQRFRQATGIVALLDGTSWVLSDPSTPRRVSHPAIARVLDAAYIDGTRALLIATPGQPWLWSDATRSATAIDFDCDVALELDSRARVRGLRAVWQWSDAQRWIAEAPRAEQSSRDEAHPATSDLTDAELRQWRAWRRRALFPFDEFCTTRAATTDAVLCPDGEGGGFALRRRIGADVPVPPDIQGESLQRFGGAIAWIEDNGAVRLLDATDATVTRIAPPTGVPSAQTVLAQDGSIIARQGEDHRSATFWTREAQWASTTLDPPLMVRHARAQKLYGARDGAIFEASPDGSGPASVREVVRLSAARPGAPPRELIATSEHEQWRTWLFREDAANECVVAVEDGRSASVIVAPLCDRGASAYFADARFGVIEAGDRVAFTRDGQTWSSRSRQLGDPIQLFVHALLSMVTPTMGIGDAIVVWGNERIERDPSNASGVVRRSTALREARVDDEAAPSHAAQCRLSSSPTTTRASRSVTVGVLADSVEARVSSDERSIDLRWRSSDGASSSFVGEAHLAASVQPPISNGSLDAIAVAAHGALLEWSGPEPLFGANPFRATHLFTAGHALTVGAVEPVDDLGVFVLADAVAIEDGWQLLLVAQRDGFDLVQWQRRDASGTVTAHGEFVHEPGRTLSLARAEDGWGAADWHDGAVSYFSFAARAWVRISAPESLHWCADPDALPRLRARHGEREATRSAANDAQSILLRRGTIAVALEGPLSIDRRPLARSLAEYRVHREGGRWRWCVDRLASRPIMTSLGPISARALHGAIQWDLRASGTGDDASGTVVARRGDGFVRAAVRCNSMTPLR